jgi:hypothetical protein
LKQAVKLILLVHVTRTKLSVCVVFLKKKFILEKAIFLWTLFKDCEIRKQITAPSRNTGVISYFFEGANLHVSVFRPQKETCEVRTFRHFKQLVAINAPQELSNDTLTFSLSAYSITMGLFL